MKKQRANKTKTPRVRKAKNVVEEDPLFAALTLIGAEATITELPGMVCDRNFNTDIEETARGKVRIEFSPDSKAHKKNVETLKEYLRSKNVSFTAGGPNLLTMNYRDLEELFVDPAVTYN